MAKQRLFSEPPKESDSAATPRDRFNDLASKVFSVPKADIDKREAEWQKARDKGAVTED